MAYSQCDLISPDTIRDKLACITSNHIAVNPRIISFHKDYVNVVNSGGRIQLCTPIRVDLM